MVNKVKKDKTDEMEIILRGDNCHEREILGRNQEQRAFSLKVSLQKIQRLDALDRADQDRKCETHVFTSKTERVEYLKPDGWKTTEMLYTRRCRYCGYQPPPERTFIHLGPAVEHPSKVSRP